MELIEFFSGRELKPEFLQRWKKLALGSRQADPCCCAPAWNLAYHKIFHPGMRAFAMTTPDAQLAFYEGTLGSGAPAWLPLEDSWMFSQPMLGFSALELLKEALIKFKNKLPIIVIGGIRENSAFARALFLGFASLFNFYRPEITILCSASLKGGVDGWLSRRSGNFRAKLKKAIRKAAHLVFERHIPSSQREAKILYNRMLAIEAKSWKGRERCGMAEPPSREFYDALITDLAQGQNARVIIAKDNEKDIGYIFGSCLGPFYRGQQFSFDQEYASLSPGNLLQFQKILWLCEQGVERYDMGPITGPRMQYKTHWTEERQEIQTWIMRPIQA